MNQYLQTLFLFTLCCQYNLLLAHGTLNDLIPTNTATHTAQQYGEWFEATTWAEGSIPDEGAIVYIPSGIEVNYEGQSSAALFAIRVDGTFTCIQETASDTTTITFDTFVGTMDSEIFFLAYGASHGAILVKIKPFDIKAYKADATNTWNQYAHDHFSNGNHGS